jgi:hypothetical protein
VHFARHIRTKEVASLALATTCRSGASGGDEAGRRGVDERNVGEILATLGAGRLGRNVVMPASPFPIRAARQPECSYG